MAKTKSCYKFYFNKIHKGWRKGKAPAIPYQEYTQDETLCVMTTLDEYIAQTEKWRSGEEHSQLFLSYIHPHKPMVSSTILGWLKTILQKSGVDMVPLRLIQPDLHQRLKQVFKVLQ